jgi:hypothetical protein
MPHDIQLPSSDVHSSNGTHQAEAARIPPTADATFTIGVAELSRFENVQVGATSSSTFWYCGDIESGLPAVLARRFFSMRYSLVRRLSIRRQSGLQYRSRAGECLCRPHSHAVLNPPGYPPWARCEKASRGFSEQTKLHEKIQRDDDAT